MRADQFKDVKPEYGYVFGGVVGGKGKDDISDDKATFIHMTYDISGQLYKMNKPKPCVVCPPGTEPLRDVMEDFVSYEWDLYFGNGEKSG